MPWGDARVAEAQWKFLDECHRTGIITKVAPQINTRCSSTN